MIGRTNAAIISGGAVVVENDVNFYDYDGTLVAAYSAADFANLSAMPANPTHAGLVAEGWNWELAAAKTYVASYGKLNIGQMYHTASGKTEYDIVIDEATGFSATLSETRGIEKDWGDGTVDTNASHTYAAAGNYTIKLSGTYFPYIQNSKKLRAVRVGNSVTNLSNSLVQCYLLNYITIPLGVTNITDQFLDGSYCLKSLTIPSSVTSIGIGAFSNCYSLQSVSLSLGIESIGLYGFNSCFALRSITIPSSVTSIGESAFVYCTSLQYITIPNSVTSIGASVFSYCSSLQTITIPNGVTTINSTVFYACSALQSVILPSSVTSIGSIAFCQCYALQSVTIPSSVTSIARQAFQECYWLTIVTVLATTPPTLSNSNAFPSNVTKIYIPNGTLSAYQTATNWSSFSSKFVELPA